MFSRIFIERPRFAIVISIVMSIAGLISVFSLPIALYPEITPPEIVVSATYPGASAEVVARTVGIPIEEQINGVENMLYMSSSSEDSSYQLTVTFKPGIDPDMAQVKVQNRIQQATSQLPTDVQRQGVSVNSRSSNILGFISVFSPDNSMTNQELSDFVQNNMKNNLTRVDGVGEVNVYSARLSMRVWLDADKIAALNIPIETIASAIQGQNYQPSLGKVGGMPGDGKQQMVYSLQTDGRINDVEEFKNIIIRTAEEGGLVQLKDIARVEVGEESYRATSRYNNVPNVAIGVNQLTGANALDAMNNLKAELQRMKQTFPKGVDYLIGYDSTEYIRASIEEVVMTLVLTFALVVLICYIFLQDWRSTLVPSLTIPVSLLATFAVMLAFGYSLNMLTLFGLVLAIGLVVDDAIVVVERVLTLMEQEKLSPKEAAIKAMSEVSSAIVATTLVLLAIFVPVGFMGGITGKIYQQFAVSIAVAVFFSAVNALTLSPALCATLLRPLKPAQHGPLFWFNNIVNKSRDTYAGIVGIFGRKIGVVAVVYALALIVIAGILHISQTSFIPSEDQGVIMGNVQLPEGASRERTEAFINKITPLIMEEPGVNSVMTITGVSMIGGSGENVAMVIAILDTWGNRGSDLYSTKVMNRLRAKVAEFSDADVQFFEPPAIMGLGMSGGMDFRLQSLDTDDPQAIETALMSMLGKMNAAPEVSYAYTTYTAKTPNIYVDIDRVKAESLKVAVGSIFSTLQYYLGSAYINDVNFGTQVNKVMVQADWKNRKDVESIKDLHVQSQTGEMVPLGSVVKLSKVLSPRVVSRYNQYPSAAITAVQNPAVSTGEAMTAVEKLAQTMPKGFGYEWSGMSYQEKSSQGQIGYLIALAVLFGYLFLVAQYESWITPLPVLTSVAVAMLGALVGLFITGLPLSIYAQLGLILLVGLASKNAILVVEFAREEHEKNGASLVKAAMVGTKERFRAVLMTAFTFILGVFPMIVATGAGAASRIAIGVPVFYGMLLGTALGLLVIPLLYVLFETMYEKFSGKKQKNDE